MSRIVTLAAAQLGPIQKAEGRDAAVGRLVRLMERAHQRGVEVVVFPELALTTFFPRWYEEDIAKADHYFEHAMPSNETAPLFEAARRYGIGFHLGYAEKTPDGHRFNTAIYVHPSGEVVLKYRKIHLPGHRDFDPIRKVQHLEKRYFEVGDLGFPVIRAPIANTHANIGMMICNDRRWPESYRVMGLQGVELILCGYNTPIHYFPDPTQDALQGFHNHLVMQSGAYQNGTWVVGAAKGGVEEGVDALADSCIIAPSGEIVARAETAGDELVVATCDLDWCERYKKTLFDFDRYRVIEHYGLITSQRGVVEQGSVKP
jgi:predicted amidohydrolase